MCVVISVSGKNVLNTLYKSLKSPQETVAPLKDFISGRKDLMMTDKISSIDTLLLHLNKCMKFCSMVSEISGKTSFFPLLLYFHMKVAVTGRYSLINLEPIYLKPHFFIMS